MNTFQVIIQTPAGKLTLRRATAATAVETGCTVEREGIGNVCISSPSGEPMRLADFAASLVKDQPDWDPA
ncbi:hypothetical protein OPKNFCMD_6706 [Methylobacterium crusticola]|uniref:AbrB/MazE/SpoVT family DNA-binding domain-containing protein n=1 Tax=Methylobacterium crusticola TaxID=1697972 RepID=A0ABQ4R953_9HYPH|nr:hypothetical protein [Methylobacterium crusticola]GJD53927.1 hypothetical protein OPKNFCMD_6706 [Methylobacterium crusticola]